MFSKKDIAYYYNSTQNHYEKWWDLNKCHSLHYGIWKQDTRDFQEALVNTNKVLLDLANIQSSDRVLDAGCGVGGAAVFVNRQKKPGLPALPLSQRQLATARALVAEKGLEEEVDFQLMDFTETSFPAETFDVIWACESICHTPDPLKFMQEAQRILKKRGRLVMFDFFKSSEEQSNQNGWLKKWCDTWAVSKLITADAFARGLRESGFHQIETLDYTPKIQKSARRMFNASLLAVVPSETYKLINPKVSRFACNHYKCGIYQYKALKAELWKYCAMVAYKR